MKRLDSIVIFTLLLMVSSLSLAGMPSFTSEGLIFDIHEFSAETDLVYFQPGAKKQKPKREQSVEIKGAVRIDGKGLDVIGFTKDLKAVRATGAEGASILKPGKPSNKKPWDEDYSAMSSVGAEVELKDVELVGNPYTLEEVVIMGQALIAKQRSPKILDAIVEEDKTGIIAGVNLRLSSMKISSKREVEIEILYDRPKGFGGPILEAVYAIDADGNTLGGGRWDKAEGVFAASIKFKSKFPIASRAKIDRLKLVFVTVYERKPYAFKVNRVFQQ